MTTRRLLQRSQLRRTLIAAMPLLAFTTVLWVKPMGLLLWARLRILTNIPRTAVAEPEADPVTRFPDAVRSPGSDSDPPLRFEARAESQGGAKSRRDRADDCVDP